jgi:hypothetical protein
MKAGAEGITTYNYPRFKAKFYQFADFTGLKEGDKFVDFKLMTTVGWRRNISDFLDNPIVLEMGSLTCPMYAGHVTPMQELAERYPQCNFLVLYVREGHPGNETPKHTCKEDKMSAAIEASQFYKDKRTIFIDELDGNAHQVYGSLPNSVYIIDTDGTIKYSKAWNNTEYLEPILKGVLNNKAVSDIKFRPAKPGLCQSYTTLSKGGSLALKDFVVELPGLLWKHYRAGNLL